MEKTNENIAAVIPVYNNAATVKAVAEGVLQHIAQVIVVDDGCTDTNIAVLFKDMPVTVLTHEHNKGKGAALLTALAYLKEKTNATHMVTIDADGQHFPSDLPLFINAIGKEPRTFFVGARELHVKNTPTKNKLGRLLSNAWYFFETGKHLIDTQSGFRAYPIRLISQIRFVGKTFDFETEVLTRASWAGIAVKELPISVWYAEEGKRITHFNPLKDTLRISAMHVRLIGRRLLPFPHKKVT